jgi:hypothetical protein
MGGDVATESWQDKLKGLKLKYIVLLCLGALIVSPIIFLIVKGIAGLIAAGVLLMGAMFGAGPLSQKMANARMKAMQKEAVVNAKSQLQNEHIRRETGLRVSHDALETLIGQSNLMVAKGRDNIRKYPDEREKYEREINAIEGLIKIRKTKYQNAVIAVAAFKKDMEKAVDELDFAAMVQDTKAAAGIIDDPLQTLLANTSLQAAQKAMNTALSELDMMLVDESAQIIATVPVPQLTQQPSRLVDLTPVITKENVR